jgi:fatty-acyl-CoA synthase
MHQEIARSLRDDIGEALARSVARNPEKTALTFEGRSWTYAELDAAANRAANALLGLDLRKGDRVAAYGRNSDAYVVLWLACARAGLIHVPVNFALTGDELLYVLNQSGARALFYDPALRGAADAARERAEAEISGTIHSGGEAGTDLLAMAGDEGGDAAEPDVGVSEEEVVQLLYTSGTTAAPKGAMMGQRAFLGL